MPRMLSSFAVCALVAAGAGRAAAQTTCSGGGFVANADLVVIDGDRHVRTLSASEQQHAVSGADCECDASDLALRIKVSNPLPPGTSGTAEVWVGSGCDDYTARTQPNQTTCEKVGSVDIDQLTNSINVGPDGILVPIPTRALVAPMRHICLQVPTSHRIYLLVFSNPAQNIATCEVSSVQSGQLPLAATSLAATRQPNGDMTVTWVSPPDPNSVRYPAGYQVLCAAEDGSPIGSHVAPSYSTCVDETLHRRGLMANAVGRFSDLDPAYVCSPPVDASATQAPVTGIDRSQKVHLVLVAYDAYGNATPSQVVAVDVAPPPPPAPPHGCSFGGAAPGSPLGFALLLALGALRVRRRKND